MLWLITILSALLYGGAFHYPKPLGFGVIVSLGLVVYVIVAHVKEHSAGGCLSVIMPALVWGMIAYGIAQLWVFGVMLDHGTLSCVMTLLMYSLFTLLFALTVALWWSAAYMLCSYFMVPVARIMSASLISGIYFFLLDRYGGIFGGQLVGYPLLSPLLPLSAYRSFLTIVAWISHGMGPGHYQFNDYAHHKPFVVRHMQPPINKRNEKVMEHLQDESNLASALYHQLRSTHRPGRAVFIAPESTYPYRVKEGALCTTLMQDLLDDDQVMLLSARYQDDAGSQNQAVFYLNKYRIIDFYVKKHLVPFGECPHPLFNQKGDFALLGGSKSNEWFNINDQVGASYFMIDSWRVVPRICSEFLVRYTLTDYWNYRTDEKTKSCIIFFVNDSWFRPYFIEMLKLHTKLQASWIGLPILYLGHDECCWF